MDECYAHFVNYSTGPAWDVSEDEPASFEEYQSRLGVAGDALKTFLQFCPTLSLFSPRSGIVLRVTKSVLDTAGGVRGLGEPPRPYLYLSNDWRVRLPKSDGKSDEVHPGWLEAVEGWYLTFQECDFPKSQSQLSFWFEFWDRMVDEDREPQPGRRVGGRPSKVPLVVRCMHAGVRRQPGESWNQFQNKMIAALGMEVSEDTLRRAELVYREAAEKASDQRKRDSELPQNA